MSSESDPFDLQRFVNAQNAAHEQSTVNAQCTVYEAALAELQRGAKRTHWMWFIFPQTDGLGHSPSAKRYAIKNSEEARQYLRHATLGSRLITCAEAVLEVDGRSASDIFGAPDDMKLRSSMTLFATLTEANPVFGRVLSKYFGGIPDSKTLAILGTAGNLE